MCNMILLSRACGSMIATAGARRPHLVKFKGAAGNVAVPARRATQAQGIAKRRMQSRAPRETGGHKHWEGWNDWGSLSGQNNASVIGANPDSTSCFGCLWWPDSDNHFDSLCSSRTATSYQVQCALALKASLTGPAKCLEETVQPISRLHSGLAGLQQPRSDGESGCCCVKA